MKHSSSSIPEPTKTYRRPMPNTWWLKKGSYTLFMLRELSSVFVAIYAIFLLIRLCALSQGTEVYNRKTAIFNSGWMIALHGVMWVFIMYNMVTWFKISGRIFGKKPLSPGLVTIANYIVWVVISVVLFFIITKG
ncbi:MAG: hypothetical protein PH343_02940 [Nitrospira sp.]|nr:hypothetical protein [Nitrospira sp.]